MIAAPKVHALDQRANVLVLLHDDIPVVLPYDVLGGEELVPRRDDEAPGVGRHRLVLRPGQAVPASRAIRDLWNGQWDRRCLVASPHAALRPLERPTRPPARAFAARLG
jgi:hypothetical protein